MKELSTVKEFIHSSEFPRVVGLNTVLKKSGEGELWLELMQTGDYKILGTNESPLSSESVIIPLPYLGSPFEEHDYASYIEACQEALMNTFLEHYDDWSVQL